MCAGGGLWGGKRSFCLLQSRNTAVWKYFRREKKIRKSVQPQFLPKNRPQDSHFVNKSWFVFARCCEKLHLTACLMIPNVEYFSLFVSSQINQASNN